VIRLGPAPFPGTIGVYSAKTVKGADGTRITRAARELEKAIAFFTNPKHYANETKLTDKTFAFEVYRDPELVDALEAAFGSKCAYCESRFAHVTPKDIEHFRPKSEVETGSGTLRPGYFWLAGEWENLLISCPDCNRGRKHDVPGQAAKVKLGKETQFPLADEQHRLRAHGGALDGEEGVRLLLNPCLDDPEQHLTFDEQALVHPRPDAGGTVSPKGTISITVFALQRKVLVEERLRVLNDLRFQLQQLAFLAANHNTLISAGLTGAALEPNAGQIRAVKTKIAGMLKADAPYLAMLREWIRTAKQRGEFASLLQFGIDPETLI